MREINNAFGNALKNVLEEPSKYLGHTITNVLKICLDRINYFAEIIDAERKSKYGINYLEEEIQAIPENKYQDPKLDIAGPIAEAYGWYLKNDDVCQLFANLLISSCHIDLSKYIHPSFVIVLKQLSPIDAKLLYCFKNFPEYLYRFTLLNGQTYTIPISKNLLNYGYEPLDSSLINLKRLGIIDFLGNNLMATLSNDREIRDSQEFKNFKYQITEKTKSDIIIQVKMTSYGKQFLKACVR